MTVSYKIIKCSLSLMLIFGIMGHDAQGQTISNDTVVDGKIEFKKLDANSNNKLEKKEVAQTWKLLKSHDKNSDGKLTLEEYLTFDIPYLKTGGPINLNVKYKSTKEEDLYLDIYYPKGSANRENLPVVVYTHGGGWFNGSKENIVRDPVNGLFLTLVEQGYVVISINYRLTNRKSVLMRDCVIDAMDALRFISKNSKQFNLDPKQLFIIGDSAGGHLAQMVMLADPSLFKGDQELYASTFKIAAGVSWYGPSDFTKIELFESDDSSKNPDRFGSRITKTEKNPTKVAEMYQEMSPIFYLKKDSPPLYMMAGTEDVTIPVAHAYHMKNAADRIQAPVELLIVRNAGHNWRKSGGNIDPSLEEIINKTVYFISHPNTN